MSWRRYQCPECEKQFAYEGEPRFCPLCGFDTAGENLPEIISSPALPRGVAKNVDGIFKAEQEGAAFRAELAGDPTLNISDQRDNLRPGDTTVVPINNPVTQAMAANPNAYGFSAQQGLAYSAGTTNGPYPNAGVRAAVALKNAHGMSGNPTSNLPALETQNPAYRSRI